MNKGNPGRLIVEVSLPAAWTLSLAVFVAFGMAQPWSWDGWFIPTLIVIVAGGILAWFLWELGLTWAGFAAAAPPVLFAVGRFLPVYWDRPVWQTIDLITVLCFLAVAGGVVLAWLRDSRQPPPA